MKSSIDRGLEMQAKVILLHLIKSAREMQQEHFLQEVHSCCERFARDYKCYAHARNFKRVCEEYLSK